MECLECLEMQRWVPGSPVRRIRVLIGDRTLPEAAGSAGWETVASPLKCLERAVDEAPEWIVIRIPAASAGEGRPWVECCAALKRIGRTRDIPLLVTLPTRHRRLMTELWKAGADYLRIEKDGPAAPQRIAEAVRDLSASDRLEVHLRKVCPHFNHKPTGGRLEIAVCGAYRNRLVLGASRRLAVCETPEFHRCPFFFEPHAAL